MSQNKYLMGVDVGTQSAKVIITDLDGNIISSGSKSLRPLDIPRPLLAEHPDDDLWDSLKAAFRRAMAAFRSDPGRNPKDIMAMGICIVRCCRAILKPDGSLAYPVINWMDKRLNLPYQHEPEFGEVGFVTTASGYITCRLTGAFIDTCANYIGHWPMDDDAAGWSDDPEAYKRCNLPRHMLFDVVRPGDILGRITPDAAEATGLPAGIPVVATAHDKAVEALGAGSLSPGTILISLGTYIGAMTHGKGNRKNAHYFWPFQASVPGRFLYECMGVRRGMWTVSWFCSQFGEHTAAEARARNLTVEEMFNREAADIPAGCEGLVTVHDWAPPVDAQFRKGVMLGFDGRHTRAHIYRSILEGIALTMKNHVDEMARELEQPVRELIVSGGGANSDLFMQIFADVFGVPARRNRIRGSAAIGSVINAGMAVRAFPGYEEAVARLVRTGETFGPDMAASRFYGRLNRAVYQQVNQYLDPLLRNLSPLVD